MYIVRLVGKLKKGNTVVLQPELESITINPTLELKTYTPTKYGFSQVTCRGVNLQSKVVNPTITGRTVQSDSGYLGLSEVEITPISLQVKAVNPELNSISVKPDSNYAGLSEVIVNSPSLQEKNVNPTTSEQTITADSHYLALSKVKVNPVNLQSKEVNPTTSVQTITADNDYIGLSSVQIEGVSSNIDENIKSENIKDGISILNTTGTYKGEKFAPSFLSFYYFRGDNLADEISKIDTSNITDMRSMFEFCEFLTELDLSTFDTSKVTSMQYLFNKNVRLQKVDLSSFDTSNVTTMFRIFRDCWGLQELKFGANWITPNVTEDFSNIGGTWTNQTTGVSYTGLNALIEAGKTSGALTGTWKKS